MPVGVKRVRHLITGNLLYILLVDPLHAKNIRLITIVCLKGNIDQMDCLNVTGRLLKKDLATPSLLVFLLLNIDREFHEKLLHFCHNLNGGSCEGLGKNHSPFYCHRKSTRLPAQAACSICQKNLFVPHFLANCQCKN